MNETETFDVVVIGGGPAGATAAHDLACAGRSVLLLDRAGRTKPCGGAIPPRLIKDFAIPDSLLVARATAARMVSPKDARVDIRIENGFVGMVDRDQFDEWLRERAAASGAQRRVGRFDRITRDDDGVAVVHFETRSPGDESVRSPARVRARAIVGADGAKSEVARQTVAGAERTKYVFAYHEILRTPAVLPAGFDPSRCDVYYRGTLSPDFYGWVFPHGATMSVGTGSADKGFSLRGAVGAPGEREKHLSRFCNAVASLCIERFATNGGGTGCAQSASEFTGRGRTLLPLPGGEGRGEGGRILRHRPISPSVSRHFIHSSSP